MPTIESVTNWTATIKGKDQSSDFIIPQAMLFTTRLEISSNIKSLYVTGTWDFSSSEFGLYMEQCLFSIGTIIEFEFITELPTDNKISLGILSITNPSTSAQYLSNVYSLTLISPWYFKDTVKAKAYQGSVTQIVNQNIQEDFVNEFASTSILEPSIDNSNAVRYRSYETFAKFVTENIVWKARGQRDTAFFYFTNIFNEFQGLSYSGIQTLPKWTLVDIQNPRLSEFVEDLSNAEKSKYYFYPLGNTLGINASPKASLWYLANPALIFINRVDGRSKLPLETPLLSPLTNTYSKKFSFINTNRFNFNFGKHYIDDSLRPYETIYTEAIQKYTRDIMDEHTVQSVGYFNFNIQPGRIAKTILNNQAEPLKDSRFSQEYMICNVSHIFVGNKGTTHLSLATPSFNFTNSSQVERIVSLGS